MEDLMTSNVVKGEDVKLIPLENLEPNSWNPQVMSDGKFNELVEEIREDGFDEPIHVVEHPDPDKSKDDIYLIVNGEHRWQAARVLGIAQIPCVIKDAWKDEKTQQIKTVRRNLLHGDLDRTRFTKLVHHLNDIGLPMKEIPALLGFESEEAFREKFIAEERERQEKEQKSASKNAREQEKNESAVVENLSFMLNEIFSEYGDTVPQGFIFFCHKNKFHLMVQMDEKLEGQIEAAVRYLRSSQKNINPFLRRALDREFDSIEEQEGADPRKAREIKGEDDIGFDETDLPGEELDDDELDDSEIDGSEELVDAGVESDDQE
jgi:hypothetical protein